MKGFFLCLMVAVAVIMTSAKAQTARNIDCGKDPACKIAATMKVDVSGTICEIIFNNMALTSFSIKAYDPPWYGRQKVFAFEITPPTDYVFGAIPFSFYKLSANGQKDGPFQIGDIRYGSDNPSAKTPGIVVAADGSKATFYLRTNSGGGAKEEFFFGVAAGSKKDPSKACIVDPKVVNGE